MVNSFISALIATFILPGIFSGFFEVSPVRAAVADAVSGYAWSPNVGWLSFNCTDASPACSGTNYGVTAGVPAAGVSALSGYAWSSNLGWLTFNAAELAGCPSGTCSASLSTAGGTAGQVSGWARSCSVFQTGCSGALKSDDVLGGWRGWISLRNASNYGVLANGTKWTGYAWGGGSVSGSVSPAVGGDAVTGWISFRGTTTEAVPSIYGVYAASGSYAEGPQVISCGVDKAIALLNESVTWTVVYDDTKISPAPTFHWFSLDGAFNPLAPVNASTKASSYAVQGVKRAMVRITTSTGQIYDVDCDGSVVPGKTDPGNPTVSVSDRDVNFDSVVIPSNAETGVPMNVTGQFDFTGLAMAIPLTARFEFDTGGDGSYDQSTTATIPTMLDNEQNRIVFASWTPGAVLSTYRIRLCVDPIDIDALNETDDTNTDNCTAWSSNFSVGAYVPPIDVSAATCKPVPRITLKDKSVTWEIAGVAGGTGTYTYDWQFAGAFEGSVNNNPSPVTSYPSEGTVTAQVTIHSGSEADAILTCTDLRIQKYTNE